MVKKIALCMSAIYLVLSIATSQIASWSLKSGKTDYHVNQTPFVQIVESTSGVFLYTPFSGEDCTTLKEYKRGFLVGEIHTR